MGKIMSWLTGRDEKESDVYANYDKVDQVVTSIKKIGKNEVENAKDAVHAAIRDLNNVNGVAKYVGNVDASAFDGVFESIATAIAEIGEQIQSKADDIKTYEESAWYEKLGSTFAMTGAKLAEGVLSVFEDIGDGAVSIVGWVAPKKSGVEKWCTNFVEKEWAHDTFNFYYDSEFAKKSTFTEDSGIAGGLKIVGETAGYLYLGGAVAGVGSQMQGATKATNAAKTFLSSTTKVNTATAALSGMGSATESGIQQGQSINEAAKSGVKQAVIQGAIAYGAGKLGERSAKKSAVNEATQQVDDAAKNASSAKETFTQARKNLGSAKNALDLADNEVTSSISSEAAEGYARAGREYDSAMKSYESARRAMHEADDALTIAKENLSKVESAKYQGYNDAITKAGQRQGESIYTLGSDIQSYRAASKAVKTGVSGAEIDKAVAKENMKSSAKDVFINNNPVAKATSTVVETVKHPVTAVKSAASTTKNMAGSVVEAVKHPVTTVKSAASTVAGTTKTVIGSAATAGVVGATIDSGLREHSESVGNAAVQFKSMPNTQISDEAKKIDESDVINKKNNVNYIVDKESPINYADGGNANNQTNAPANTNNGSTGGNPSGGGYSGGGSSGGGYSGGGSTGGIQVADATTTGEQQFRQDTTDDINYKDEIKDTDKNTGDTSTSTTPNYKPLQPDDTANNSTNYKPLQPDTNNNSNNSNSSNNNNNNNNNSGYKPLQPNNQSTITTQPSGTTPSTTTQHTGGGYTGSGGYKGYTSNNNSNPVLADATTGKDTSNIKDAISSSSKTSIDDVIKGSKYTKIPTSSKPITASASGGGGSTVIPVVAGLSAAAAAGIGAKVYMDRKKNNENGEYDEIDTEDWAGEDTIDLDYDESSNSESYLDEDDDYGYQTEEQTEKYDARNSQELADLQ